MYETKETVTLTDGKRSRKSFYGKTEKEARRNAYAYQVELDKGKMFSDIADEWKEKHWKNIEHGTQMCYSPACKRAKAAFEGDRIREIRPPEIHKELIKLKNQGYSAQTVKVQLVVYNMIFTYAIAQGYVEANVASDIKVPRGLPRTARTFPSDEDINVVKMSYQNSFGLFAYFLIYTGLRREEALPLEWADIDFEKKEITIEKKLEFINNKPVVSHKTKTDKSKRKVLLLDALARILKPNSRSKYVFFDVLPTETSYNLLWRKYCTESGLMKDHPNRVVVNKKTGRKSPQYIPRITPHQLRHCYATFLFEAGVDEKDAQDQLGHADVQTTKDIYTHIRNQRRQTTASKLNDYLNSEDNKL